MPRQELLEAHYQASIDGILMVDAAGRIVSYNQRFATLWGIPGRVLEAGSDEKALACVLDKVADAEEFLARVRELYSKRYLRALDQVELKDGRTLDRYSTPVFGPNKRYQGRVWYFRDVTERRHAEENRRAMEARYRELFEAESDGVLVVDEKSGRVEDANRAAAKLLGYDRHELIGFRFDHFSAEEGGMLRALSGRARPQALTRRLSRKDGSSFPGELTAGRFTQGGRTKIIATLRDGTERERAAQAEFFRQREELQRQVVATVSHELRTPIAAIHGFAETLLGGALEDRKTRKEFTSTILKHSRRLARLVDDLLALSVLEAGRRPMKAEALDAQRYLQDFAAGLEPVVRRRRASLSVEARAGIALRADPCQVTQALQNLVDNALKHCGPGVKIRLRAAAEEGAVRFSVADDGPGIPKENLGRVFEPFFRVDGTKAAGAGLGLAIVKQVADTHGGRAWVESRKGAGTTFFLWLPAAPVAAA